MRKQLKLLREKMRERGVDVYLVFTSDYHGSEYVGDYFKVRQYVSGFTGSAGTLVVTQKEAGLWTDGRYFLQAERQLDGSGITLYKEREPRVPTIEEYLENTLEPGQVLGVDGRCVMADYGKCLEEITKKNNAKLVTNLDLGGEIWEDRPPLSRESVWPLPVEYAGETSRDKISRVREFLARKGADYFLLTSLEDIAWLLNMRGNDVESTPVVLSYLLLGRSEIIWYVEEACLCETVKKMLLKEKISVRPYEAVYKDVAKLPESSCLYYDEAAVNSALVACIPDGVKCIKGVNPTFLFKAIKNPVEVENERKAHVKDGVAVTKFIFWLKTRVGKEKITEMSAAQHLIQLRKQQEHYVEESFEPIIAYKEHGAIVHYSATEDTDVELKPESFVLADTGGHYLEGTTDITRTIALGPLTREEKEMYTTVLRGHINLAAAQFLHGCTGQSLDALARTPLWEKGLDYNHGTGHGVGYLLSVHEGPNSFRYRPGKDGRSDCVFEEGMITSDEPGLYLEGKFGIRLENLLVCLKSMNNGKGNFFEFEPLTLVPFDRDAIVPELLTEKEKKWLNGYHKKVYETLSPHLKKEEAAWLKDAAGEIS